jgi:hypothetical protein
MSVRPTLLRDIKKTAVQQHQANIGYGTYNRFQPLIPRGRILSTGKRQLENNGDDDTAGRKAPRLDANLVFNQLKDQDSVIAELETAIAEIEKSNTENPDPRLDAVVKILKLLGKSQKNLTSAVTDSCRVAAKAAAPATSAATINTGRKPPPQQPTAEEVNEKKLKTVLREAEKKTVIFNLDLGKNQAMNKDTLSRKVTEALGTAVRSGQHDYHIGDAEEVLDDILSCSKLEFLGTKSKLFFNNRNMEDERNNNMYTMPVRMEFKDRDTRFESEIMLRKLCKVNCSVPYPKKLRDKIAEMGKIGKTRHPNCYIRTKVSVDNLTVEAHAKTTTGWVDLGLKSTITCDILDNSTVQPVSASASASQPALNLVPASQSDMVVCSQVS